MSSNKQKTLIQSLIHAQRIDDAKAQLLNLYEQDKEDIETWHLLATVNILLREFESSAQWSRKVTERYPHLVAAWINLATASQESGDHQSALEAYSRVLQLQPHNVQALLDIAGLHLRLGNQADALKSYQNAINLRPNSAELRYNFGTFHQALGNYRQAEQCYLEALALKPDLIQAHNNLGLVYQEQCRLDEALQCFNKALCESEPRETPVQENTPIAETHRHRALLWLLQGNFNGGWLEYEWRHTDPAAVQSPLSSEPWDGSSLTGKSILVIPEQGIGDEIMFASCIPDLAFQAGHVILECNPRLEPLFQRSFTGVEVRAINPKSSPLTQGNTYTADTHIMAGSLPRFLRSSPDAFTRQAFLKPDPQKVRAWQNRYTGIGNSIKIGISWHGGSASHIRKKRSTHLQQWLPVFGLKGIQFVNLQYGDCTADLRQLSDQNNVTIYDWPDADPLQSMDFFAAQVAALDLVISVDNATVHVAGASGVPVWILQPFSPEWRWLLGCDDSYWYPGVRQFRQPSIDDWESVFEMIQQALITRYGLTS